MAWITRCLTGTAKEDKNERAVYAEASSFTLINKETGETALCVVSWKR